MVKRGREQLLLYVAIGCLSVLAGNIMVIQPLWSAWKSRSARIGHLRQSIDRGRLLLQREDTMRERWRLMQEISLPAEASTTENTLLNSLNRWSERSGLQITGLRPNWNDGEPEVFRTLEIRATGRGSMRSITGFILAMEEAPIPIAVERIGIAARDDSGNDLNLTLRLAGLVLLEKTP